MLSFLNMDTTAFSFPFETKPRRIYDHYIIIDGIKFDADDLHETLSKVYEDGDLYTTGFRPDAASVLQSRGILESQGAARAWSPAKLGPRGEEFIRYLEGVILHSVTYNED